MRKKLIELETLLKKQSLHANTFDSTQTKELQHALETIDLIKQHWLEEAANPAQTANNQNETLQTQYSLSRIQVAIANEFEDKLDQNANQLPTDIQPLSQKVINGLEELQTILEKCFAQNLDQTVRIPILILPRLSRNIQENLPKLKSALNTRKVDHDLLTAILQPLEAIAQPTPQQRIQTGKLIVVRELIDHLLELLNPANLSPDVTMQLLNTVTYCNLNTLSTVTETIKMLKTRYAKDEFPLEKLFTIQSQVKHFHEIPTKPMLSYENTNRHFKVLLIEWLEAQQQLQENEIAEWNTETGNTTSMKIETSLNVKEIGLLIRLFYECGVLLNKNKKRLVRLFARSVQSITKKEDTPMSEFKLWNATYNSTYITLINTRRQLKKMLGLVDEYIKETYHPGNTKKL